MGVKRTMAGMKLKAEHFREYDVRADGSVFGETETRLIARAVALEASERGGVDVFCVARDGRKGGESMARWMADELRRCGLRAVELGMAPTPLAYWAANRLTLGSALIATASHNPASDNGVKIAVNGLRWMGDDIQALARRIGAFGDAPGKAAPILAVRRPDRFRAAACGSVADMGEVFGAYRRALAHRIGYFPKRKWKIALDCSNGSASPFAPRVLRELGWEVVAINDRVDGQFAHLPDPLAPSAREDLVRAMRRFDCDAGFALDGDGDRAVCVLPSGEALDPGGLTLFLLDAMARRRMLPGRFAVAGDVKLSPSFFRSVLARGGRALMSRPGNGYMRALAIRSNSVLACETSAHHFLGAPLWDGSDDGTVVSAWVLAMLAFGAAPPEAQLRPYLPSDRSLSVWAPAAPSAAQERAPFGPEADFGQDARTIAPNAEAPGRAKGCAPSLDGGAIPGSCAPSAAGVLLNFLAGARPIMPRARAVSLVDGVRWDGSLGRRQAKTANAGPFPSDWPECPERLGAGRRSARANRDGKGDGEDKGDWENKERNERKERKENKGNKVDWVDWVDFGQIWTGRGRSLVRSPWANRGGLGGCGALGGIWAKPAFCAVLRASHTSFKLEASLKADDGRALAAAREDLLGALAWAQRRLGKEAGKAEQAASELAGSLRAKL